MENSLRALFEFQRFQGNKRLEGLIAQAEQDPANGLDDAALTLVAAAGEPTPQKKEDADHDT